MSLTTFEIEPTEPQRGSVIWMHGLGASNHDFDDIVPLLRAPFLRFVFPAAPIRAVTVNRGMRMPAWYDILSFDNPALREKASDVREAAVEVQALVARENARGVAYENIVLAGFSQGAAMALHVGVRSEQRLAGVMVLSGYLLLAAQFEAERHAGSAGTPFLVCHGRHDPVVPVAGGRQAYTRLKEAGYPTEWAEFEMQHSLCMEEVSRIEAWLAQRFA